MSMKIFIMPRKFILVAASLFPGLAWAQSGCLDEAGAMLKDLLPAAEQVAGRRLQIEMPDTLWLGKISNSSAWIGNQSYYGEAGVAEVDAKTGLKTGRFPVLIYVPFCRKPAALKQAILAHELGHVIDLALNGEHGSIGDWETRKAEINATRHGIAVMRSAGLDVQAMRALFAWTSEAYKKAAGLTD